MNDINVKILECPKRAANLEPLFQDLVKKNEDDPLAIDSPSCVDQNTSSKDVVEPVVVADGLGDDVFTVKDAKDESMEVDELLKDVDLPIVVEIAEENINNDAISNGEAAHEAEGNNLSTHLNCEIPTTIETKEAVIDTDAETPDGAKEENKTDIDKLSYEQNTSPNTIESKEDVPKTIEINLKVADIEISSETAVIEMVPKPDLSDIKVLKPEDSQPNVTETICVKPASLHPKLTADIDPEASIITLSLEEEFANDKKEIINIELQQTVPIKETKEIESMLLQTERSVENEPVPNLKDNLPEKPKENVNDIESALTINKIIKSQNPDIEKQISESPSPNSDNKKDDIVKPSTHNDKIGESIAHNDKNNDMPAKVNSAEHAMTIETEDLSIQAVIKAVDEKSSSPKQDSPPEVILKDKDSSNDKDMDTEMVEMVPDKVDKKGSIKVVKPEDLVQPVNGDVSKEEQSIKRRPSDDIEAESPLKKLCQEVEKTFPQHDTMINEYIQTATKNNIDEIQKHTEQLLAEIQTLRELAQKKEHEWNNILHLKKVKEEILLRLLRRKQVISFEKAPEMNGSGSDRKDPFEYLNQAKNLAIDKSDEISGLALRQPVAPSPPMNQPPMNQPPNFQPPMMPSAHFGPMTGLPPPYDKVPMQGMPNMSKAMFPQSLMMPGPTMQGFPRDMNGGMPTNYGMPMGRQGPTKDVKSIIADYRQRNPDVTPRRGRRMKSLLNPNMMNSQQPRPIAPKLDNLGNLGMIFNNLDMNQKAMLERLSQMQGANLPNGMSFKDVLVQFASMQQQGMMPMRPDLMPGRPDQSCRIEQPSRPEPPPTRPEPPRPSRRTERTPQQHHEEVQISMKSERVAASSPRLPPPPPYPEISLLPVSQETQASNNQNSLLHGILTKQASPASQSCSPTLAKLLTSPELKQASATLPTFGQAKNCGEITITPVQPAATAAAVPEATPQDKPEEIVQLDDEESPASEGSTEEQGAGGGGGGRLVIDEGGAEADTPLCQGCRRRDAQFVCAGCANQWYCSRDCQVAAWDEHSEMCSG